MNLTKRIPVASVIKAGGAGLPRGREGSHALPRRRALAGFQWGLEQGAHLLELMREMQMHRGLSAGWLCGEESFAIPMRERQARIASLLCVVEEGYSWGGSAALPEGAAEQDVAGFFSQWRELLEDLPRLTPEATVQRHSALIRSLFDWLETVARTGMEPTAGPLMDEVRSFSRRLPELTECLGQMRALGSAVAARRSCSPVSRVRLLFLASRSQALLSQALLSDAARPPLEAVAAKGAVEQMVHTVRASLLLAEVDVLPADFFSMATQAIDSVFDWIGASVSRLGQVVLQVSDKAVAA